MSSIPTPPVMSQNTTHDVVMPDRPVVDCWSKHKVRFYYMGHDKDIVIDTELAGYSYTCVPIAWVEDKPEYRQINIPSSIDSDKLYGRNKYLQLAVALAEESGNSQHRQVRMYPDHRIVVGEGGMGTSLDWRIEMPSSEYRDGRAGIWGSGYQEFPINGGNRPIATWQPCNGTWSLEPDDAVTETRRTSSPYSERYSTTMVWGTRHTSKLYVDMVPAADIYGYRAIDIPHKGWAAKADRSPGKQSGSTLEACWPWLARATPQRMLLDKNQLEGWWIDLQNNAKDFDESWGTPAILYLDEDMLMKGYALAPELSDSTLWDDFRAQQRDDMYRHIILSERQTLKDAVESRVGVNRAYRVQIPFIDTTPPGIARANGHYFEGQPSMPRRS